MYEKEYIQTFGWPPIKNSLHFQSFCFHYACKNLFETIMKESGLEKIIIYILDFLTRCLTRRNTFGK